MGRYRTDEEVSDTAAEATASDEAVEPTEAPEQDTPEGEGEEGQPEVPDEEPAAEGETPEAEEDTYTIKVGGKEVSMPVSELAKGYLRQQDYSRKTAELAQQRDVLNEAAYLLQYLNEDPARTIAVLAQNYGVDLGNLDMGGYEAPSAEQQRIAELEAWRQAELQRQQTAMVDDEIARLHRDYGDFDDDELFRYAVEHDVRHLETALRSLRFDSNGNGAPRVDKRRVAAQAGGQAHASSVRPKVPASEIRTFQDAYKAAKAELQSGS